MSEVKQCFTVELKNVFVHQAQYSLHMVMLSQEFPIRYQKRHTVTEVLVGIQQNVKSIRKGTGSLVFVREYYVMYIVLCTSSSSFIGPYRLTSDIHQLVMITKRG
jgi:hypothetical protein